MGETLDHLEKVIRDIPEGSLTVEPLNHIEKVIQEVGQEIAESQGGGGELYNHNIRLYYGSTYCVYLTYLSSKSSFTKDEFISELKR